MLENHTGKNLYATVLTFITFENPLDTLFVLIWGQSMLVNPHEVEWANMLSFYDKSTSGHTMAHYHQATLNYLNLCRPGSKSLYGVTRPQKVSIHIRCNWVSPFNSYWLPNWLVLVVMPISYRHTLNSWLWMAGYCHQLRLAAGIKNVSA